MVDAAEARAEASVPIASLSIAGVPLAIRAARNLLASGCLDLILVAVSPAEVESTAALFVRYGLAPVDGVVVFGADTTAASTIAVAVALAAEHDLDPEVVLWHDVRRPFVPAELTTRVVDAVRDGARAVIPVLPCSDTVKRLDTDGVVTGDSDRSHLRVAQTPEGFALAALRTAGEDTVHADPLDRLRRSARTVAGHPDASAIRSVFDVMVAEASLAAEAEPA